MNDYQMYSHERMKFANVSSTSIIEELGQVDYIFSDKTGTLTRNVMEFKLLHCGGTMFGNPADLEPSALVDHTAHNSGKGDLEYSFKSDELDKLLRN